MNLSELINEILVEWAYRIDDGQPNPKNQKHISELSLVLSEMGLSEIKHELIQTLTEADSKQFKNPALNKEIPYKDKDNKPATGIVGNLLRLPKDHPGRKAAEAQLPPEGSEERDSMNKDLGSEKDGRSTGGEQPQGEKPKDGEAGGGQPKEDPIKAAAAMYDPKADPAMGARLDREKKTLDKLAQKDKEKSDADAEAEKATSGETPEGQYPPISEPPPPNEKGEVDADGKIVGTEIEVETGLDEVPKSFLDKISTKMNDFYNHFKEDRLKAEEKAMEFFGYTQQDVNRLSRDKESPEFKAYNDEVKKHQEPTFNLCSISIPGTNLFCDGNKGITRDKMPQFKGKPEEGSQAWNELEAGKKSGKYKETDTEVEGEPFFRQLLADRDIKVTDAQIAADSLKATQSELVGDKVMGMKSVLDKGPEHPSYKKITAPIFVSKDGYVVDGHHRWAAITAHNIENPDNPLPMNVMIIDKDIDEAIDISNEFASNFGVAAKSGKQTGPQSGENPEPPKDEPSRPDTTPPTEDDSTSNTESFTGEESGEEIKTLPLEGDAQVYGVKHRNTKMVDDIINNVKDNIPEEKWKDVVFVGEGGATNKETGELEFNDEMVYAADKFKQMGAGIDTFDGDDLDVHKPDSKLYKKQIEKTGLNQSQVNAGNWASMIGQGEGTDTMKPTTFLDEDGKQFLQDAAKEAGFAPIENWDNPTDKDKDTLYRLSFPEDNGDKETKINDIQVAFNEIRDENLLEKTKELKAQGKIPITIAGEGHIDLLSKKKKEQDTVEKPEEKLPEPKAANETPGGVIYSIGGGYYSDTPDGPAQYVTTESIVEKVLIEGDESLAYLLFEAVVNKVTAKGKKVRVQTIDPKKQKKATAKAAAAEEPTGGSVTDNGPAITTNIAPDEDPTTGKGAKEIDSKKFNSKQFTESTIRQKQAFDNVEAAYPKIKRHDYQYPKGVDTYLKKVMHPAAFEAMDTLIKLSKGGDFVPPISMITDQYGAGKISAQMNELCMQAAMAFPPTKEGIAARNAFIESLRQNNRDIVKSKQTPILDDTWIDEFEGASNAFNGAMNRQHGVGNWKVVGTTWDVRSQNEDRGINYDDKGFSTDINIQVEAGGKRENVEISCKKDWKIFLLNAGLGDAENWYYTLGPEKEKRAMDLMQKAAAKIKLSKEEIAELKSLSEQALSKAPVSNKKLQEDQYESAVKGAEVIDGIETKELSRIYKQWVAGDYEGGVDKKGKVKSVKDPEFTLAAIKAHAKVGITNEAEFHDEMKRIYPGYKPTKKYYKKAVVCINNMLAQTKTDDDSMAWYKSHMGITSKFIQDAAQTLVRDKEYRKMLLRKLQEAIPLKTMTEGVETMQIDSMYITQEHMGKLFGTTDWKDIRQYLDVQVINGEGVLVYKAKGKATSEPISIAKIGIREKGKGYDGNPALEVKPSDEFESNMRRIETELASGQN